MGKRITILFLFLPFVLCAQIGKYLKNRLPEAALIFTAGAADGMRETIQHHYNSDFKRKFPKANDQFWDPKISWKNKYKNGDPEKGEKFLGSSTLFVWTTDGYHLLRTTENLCYAGAILIAKTSPKKQKIFKWQPLNILTDFVFYSMVKSAGFHCTYTLL
jgi:hypothetical protein